MKLLILSTLTIPVCGFLLAIFSWGCYPASGSGYSNNGKKYQYNNLIVQDAHGNFYVLVSDKYYPSTYFCNPVTNISFAVGSKTNTITNLNKSN